jgi:O-antigen ligase
MGFVTRALAPRRDGSVVALVVACLLVAAEFSGAYGPLAAVLPFSGFTALLDLGVLVALATAPHWWWRVPFPVIAAMALFVVARAVSALGSSVSPSVTAEAVSDSLKQLVFLVVVILLVTAAPEQSRWPVLAGSITAALAVVCSFAVVDQWLLGNGFHFFGFEVVTTALGVGVLAPRHAGALPDANFWGRFLALGLPFALALIATSRPRLAAHVGERSRRRAMRRLERAAPSRRALALVAVVLMAAGLYLTGSRGSFIAAGLGTLVFLAAVAVPVRRLLWGLPLAAVALAVPGVGSRLFSSFSVADSAQRAGADGSVVERLATQRVALRMVEGHPLTGVGPDGYLETFARTAATTDLTLTRAVAPHNLYLGLWAETGLLGLLSWLAVVGVALALGLRVVAFTAGSTDPSIRELRPFGAAAVAGVVAWSSASVFLHLSYVRVLLVVIAGTVVLDRELHDRVARAEATSGPSVAGPVTSRPPALRRSADLATVRRWSAVGAAVALVGALVASSVGGHRAEATLSGWLVPSDDGTYALALRTRSAVLPTFAVAVGSATDGRVDAQGDPTSGLVTLSVTAPSSASAVALVRQAADSSPQVLAGTGLDRFYRLRWSEPRTSTSPDRLARGLGFGGGAAVLGALAGALVAIRRISTEEAT